MKFIKRNLKLVVAFTLGLIFSGTVAYATGLFDSEDVNFNNTTAQLKKPDNSNVTNVQEAIEAINRKIPATCSNSPFNLGDYVDMTPTSTSFTPDRTLTGLDDYDTWYNEKNGTSQTTAVAGELHPNYLNVWRVIRINSDCTVEVVSEYVSDQNVKFASKVGYQNYVYYLNEIAKQYANIQFTLNPATAPDGAFRNVGYDGQTKQIDTTKSLPTGYTSHPLNDENLGKTDANGGHWYKKTTSINGEESFGGGDQGFVTDLKLMDDAGVSYVAYKKTSTAIPTASNATLTSYWLASRLFLWSGTSSWAFYARFLYTSGNVGSDRLWYRSSSSWYASSNYYAVRPIVTLDPELFTVSGEGTSASHRILTAK